MNTFLRRARIQAGLTQEELAAILGTTTMSVWRWESGRATPSPFFREAISDFLHYGRAEHDCSTPSLRKKVRFSSFSPFVDTPVSHMPALFVGQHAFLARSIDLLCSLHGPQRVGLTGMVGSGKTTLVRYLCTTPAIQETFAAVFWTSVGHAKDPLCHLQRWADLLGLGKLPPSLAEAQNLLRMTIGQRRVLYVLDDVCSLEDVLPYFIESPSCCYIIITRQPGLAHFLCLDVLRVPELTESDAFTLVSAHLPAELVQEHTLALQDFVRDVRRHPRALVLMGEALRQIALRQPARRFRQIISYLQHSKASVYFQTDTRWQSLSFVAAFQQYESELPPLARIALRQLATLFQTKRFSELEASRVLSDGLQQELDNLLDAGLLEWSEQNFYYFHPLVVAYVMYATQEETPEMVSPAQPQA